MPVSGIATVVTELELLDDEAKLDVGSLGQQTVILLFECSTFCSSVGYFFLHRIAQAENRDLVLYLKIKTTSVTISRKSTATTTAAIIHAVLVDTERVLSEVGGLFGGIFCTPMIELVGISYETVEGRGEGGSLV